MLPFEIRAVVACDDVRQEQNNKHILIGVYNGTIVVPGFPAELQLSWWLQVYTTETGKFDLELQLIRDDTSKLLRAMLQFEVHEKGWASLVLPKVPIQFQGPGKLKLQMKRKEDEKDWEDVQELDLRQGTLS